MDEDAANVLDPFDSENILGNLVSLLEKAKTGEIKSVKALEEYLEVMSSFFELTYGDEKDLALYDLLEDATDERPEDVISNIINGDDFGWGPTEEAIESPQVLALVYKHLCPIFKDLEYILAQNPNISTEIASQLIISDYRLDNGEGGSIAAIASNTQDDDLLKALATSNDPNARYWVALRSNDPSVLSNLADDNGQSSYPGLGTTWIDTRIQFAVISNPSTPTATLAAIASGKHAISAESPDPKDDQELNLALQVKAQEELNNRFPDQMAPPASNSLFDAFRNISLDGHVGYLKALFNIESGLASISDERMPYCAICETDIAITSECATCGRTDSNFIRFKACETTREAALIELLDPATESKNVGALILTDPDALSLLYGKVTNGGSPLIYLDTQDYLPNMDGTYIGSVTCYGPESEKEIGTELSNHVLYVGDAHSDESGQYALPSFLVRPGNHEVYLFGKGQAYLILPEVKAREYELSQKNDLAPKELIDLAIGQGVVPDWRANSPQGIVTVKKNAEISKYNIVQEEEPVWGAFMNHIGWILQLVVMAPQGLPNWFHSPEVDYKGIVDYFMEDEERKAAMAKGMGFRLPASYSETGADFGASAEDEPKAPEIEPTDLVREFSLVTSPLDGDYDPVAEFEKLVKLGLIEPMKPYGKSQNEEKNRQFITTIETFIQELERLIDNRPHSTREDIEILSETDSDLFDEIDTLLSEFLLEECSFYSAASSDALISLLETTIQFDYLFDAVCSQLGLEYADYLGHLLGFLNSVNCPRPVLWFVINRISKVDMAIRGLDEMNPYLVYAIGENPLVGDRAYQTHLDGDPTPLTCFAAFVNPSITIDSLELLEYWHISTVTGGAGSVNWFSEDFDFSLFNLEERQLSPSNVLLPDPDELGVVLARIFDEIKVGRLTWARVAQSPHIILRSIAMCRPGISAEEQKALVDAGIIEFYTQVDDAIRSAIEKPLMSMISRDLAGRMFP
jgi:hypothetical protein